MKRGRNARGATEVKTAVEATAVRPEVGETAIGAVGGSGAVKKAQSVPKIIYPVRNFIHIVYTIHLYYML